MIILSASSRKIYKLRDERELCTTREERLESTTGLQWIIENNIVCGQKAFKRVTDSFVFDSIATNRINGMSSMFLI